MYAPLSLDGSYEKIRLVRETAIPRMRYPCSASDKDAILLISTCFTLGFAKSWGIDRSLPGASFSIGESAFGHPGTGGSLGFADPSSRLAFGYTMNKLGSGVSLDQRAQSLIDAVYRTLGYTTKEPGFWI